MTASTIEETANTDPPILRQSQSLTPGSRTRIRPLAGRCGGFEEAAGSTGLNVQVHPAFDGARCWKFYSIFTNTSYRSIDNAMGGCAVLKKAGYLAAEIGVLFLIFATLMGGFMWFNIGWEGLLPKLLSPIIVLAALFAAIRGATIGLHFRGLGEGLAFGFYQPIRPIAFFLPVQRLASTQRQALHFSFAKKPAGGPVGVIEALSRQLNSLGVRHSRLGGVTVKDGSVRWRLEPDFKTGALVGWIEAKNKSDRHQTVSGLTSFFADDLGLVVTH